MCDGDHKAIAKAIKDRVSLISRKRAQRQQVCPQFTMMHFIEFKCTMRYMFLCCYQMKLDFNVFIADRV